MLDDRKIRLLNCSRREQDSDAERFRDHGCEPVGGTPEATADFVRNEAASWKWVIADAAITAD